MIEPNHPELPIVRRRFAEEEVVWLVTVRSDGQPQASPVWAIWDEEGFLIYSKPDVGKMRNIDTNPLVSLHLDGGQHSHTTAIIEGEARRSDDPPPHEVPQYLAKYADGIARLGSTPEEFSAAYSVPIRVRPTRLRAW